MERKEKNEHVFGTYSIVFGIIIAYHFWRLRKRLEASPESRPGTAIFFKFPIKRKDERENSALSRNWEPAALKEKWKLKEAKSRDGRFSRLLQRCSNA
jgi:hypothetical protein